MFGWIWAKLPDDRSGAYEPLVSSEDAFFAELTEDLLAGLDRRLAAEDRMDEVERA